MSQYSWGVQIIGLIVCLLFVAVAACLGAIASLKAGQFYNQLNRPRWAPPAWIFGPAWTILYLLMAIAVWLIWRINGLQTVFPLALFLIQLVFNAVWSWLFFYLRQGALALLDVILLWGAILLTLIVFWSISPLAAILLIPYLAWVSFATALNFSVWRRNPVLLSGNPSVDK